MSCEDKKITLKDVIEVIAEGYDVQTLKFIRNIDDKEKSLCGICINEGGQKEILINNLTYGKTRRVTILHELYHAVHDIKHLTQAERRIEALAERSYTQLYEEGEQ